MDETKRDQIALFKYQVIAPLLSITPGGGRLRKAMRQLALNVWDIPYSDRTTIAWPTIEEWLYKYRSGGFDALKPATRADTGSSRAIPQNVQQAIEELLKARPGLTVPLVVKELQARGMLQQGQVSSSALYRFLKARGLDKRHINPPQDKRAFAFDAPNDCWQADLLYGPKIPAKDGTLRTTYLYAILDDCTRIICHGQFYFHQHLTSFIDALRQALLKRGCPKCLYIDNALIFRSKHLMLIAATLGIHIIHSRPYRPAGRGKVERWFLSVRASFLKRLDTRSIPSIEHLNRLLWAWIEGEYHVSIHRTLREAPLDKWLRLGDALRPMPPDMDLEKLFLHRVTRRVKKDGTFTLKGKLFEAPVTFIGQKIFVHFDPFDLRKIHISGEKDHDWVQAFPLDLEANRLVARDPEPPAPAKEQMPLFSLEHLAQEFEKQKPWGKPKTEGEHHGKKS